MKVTVLGWYDHGNVGDESYKITIPEFVKSPCTFTDKLNEDSDIFILGGGHVVLTDFVDQLKDKFNKYILSATVAEDAPFKLLKDFKKIIVRDKISQQNLTKNDIPCTLMPDLAFLLKPDRDKGKDLVKELFKGKHLYNKLITVVINSHLTPPSGEFLARNFNAFQGVVEQLTQIIDTTPASFLFVPFGQQDPHDDRVTNGWLASRCKYWKKNVVIYNQMQPQSLIDIVAYSDAVISTRLHASIFSCISGTPFVDITHHSKNTGFLETIDRMDWSIPYWQFNSQKCASLLKDFLNEARHREELLKMSEQQTEMIKEVGNVCSLQ